MQIINSIVKNNCFILTGGPGAGKTTVLNELRKRGIACLEEVAREIIRQQMETGGNALPWADVLQYKKIMLEKTINQFMNEGSEPSRIYFFDRGIPDIVSYSRLIKAPVENFLDDACRRYRCNKVVFIFPPWKEIYTTDNERKQHFEEAVRTYEVLKETYQEYHYQIIDIPPASVEERADLIVALIKNAMITS